MDQVTGEDKGIIEHGGQVDRVQVSNGYWNLRVTTIPYPTGSVAFYINGRLHHTDNTPPYISCKNTTVGCIWLMRHGTHTVKAIAYESPNRTGFALPSKEITFDVFSSSPVDGVVAYYLHDVLTGVEATPGLVNGSSIDRADFTEGEWNIRGHPQPYPGSVAVFVDGRCIRIDNEGPFFLCESNNTAIPCRLSYGWHKIEFRAYSDANARGNRYPYFSVTVNVTASAQVDGVMQVFLVDANNGQQAGEVFDGQFIDRSLFYTGRWNLLAKMLPRSGGSVLTYVNGRRIHTANDAPYTACGYNHTAATYESCVWKIGDGERQVVLRAFRQANGRGEKLPFKNFTLNIGSSQPVDGVVQLAAVNVANNSLITNVNNFSTIDRSNFTEGRWNLEAVTAPSTVGSVRFYVNRRLIATDNSPPYRLCEDTCYYSDGTYIIAAVAYTAANGRGYSYPIYNISFNLRTSTKVDGVMAVFLVDAQTNQTVREVKDGDMIDRAYLTYGRWNLKAQTIPSTIGSVATFVNNRRIHYDNNYPYSACGDIHGDYQNCIWKVRDGEHNFKFVPYTSENLRGFQLPDLSLTLNIFASSPAEGVIYFRLIDANNGEFKRNIINGSLIDRAEFEQGKYILIPVLATDDINSVRFYVNNRHFSFQNDSSLSLCRQTEYCKFADGFVTIKAVSYLESDGSGKTYPPSEFVIEVITSQQVNGVMTMSLVESATGNVKRDMIQDDLIDRSQYSLGQWNIFANTIPKEVGSVRFFLNGRHLRTDNDFPFTACGDNGTHIESCLWKISDGNNVIKALAYTESNARGELLPGQEFRFNLMQSRSIDGVVGFILVDINSNEEIRTISDGEIIDRSMFYRGNWTLKSIVQPDNIGSVAFSFNGRYHHTDNSSPFSLCGDSGVLLPDYQRCMFEDGPVEISATAYTKDNRKGNAYSTHSIRIFVFTSSQVEGVMSLMTIESLTMSSGVVIQNEAVIDRAQFKDGRWNMVAELIPSNALLSVYINNRRIRKDNSTPFTVCGDSPGFLDTCLWSLPDGHHTIRLTAFEGNLRLPGRELNVTIVTSTKIDGAISLTLVDAENQVLNETISENSAIDRSRFFRGRWNILANVAPIDYIESVAFYLDGRRHTVDNLYPYTLCGDNNGTYYGCSSTYLPDGEHNIKVVAYTGANAKGKKYPVLEHNITTTTSTRVEGVMDLQLIDSLSGDVHKSLPDFSVIERSNFTHGMWNILVDMIPEQTGSIRIYVDGRYKGIDNTFPFTVCGDVNGTFLSCLWTIPEGLHILKVIPYELKNGKGGALPHSEMALIVQTSQRVDGPLHFDVIDENGSIRMPGFLNNAVIDRSNFYRGRWNLHIQTAPEVVGSVKIYVNGRYYRVDNTFPYYLCEDNCARMEDGFYSIKMIAYTEAKGRGKAYPATYLNLTVSTTHRVEGIMQILLVDSVNGTVLRNLSNNSVVDRGHFTHGQWGLQIVTLPAENVTLFSYVDGRQILKDNNSPFQACPINLTSSGLSTCVWHIKDGAHKLLLKARESLGKSHLNLPSSEIRFEVVSPPHIDGVTHFTLMDAFTNTESKIFKSGSHVVDRADYNLGRWNLRAEAFPKPVGSIKFYIDGRYSGIDNEPPFTLCPEQNGNYHSCYLRDGNHTVSALAYTEKNGRGYRYKPHGLNLTIITSRQVEGVFEFTFVDAFRDQDIRTLGSNDVIDRANAAIGSWNIVAHTKPTIVGSVSFYLNNRFFFRDNIFPYSLCGDNNTDYNSCWWKINHGSYRIKTVAHELANGRGRSLPGKEINVTIFSSENVDGVTQIALADAQNNMEVRILGSGSVVERADFFLGRWNLIARTEGPAIGSVRFYVNGRHYALDSEEPYTLCGDENGDLRSCRIPDGNIRLTAIAYTGLNGKGKSYSPYELNFTISTSEQVEGVMSFELLDAVTGKEVGQLTNGTVVDRSEFTAGAWNVLCKTLPGEMHYVSMYINGRYTSKDVSAPYTVCGDTESGNFTSCFWRMGDGDHTILAQPFYNESGRIIKLPHRKISFTVVTSKPVHGITGVIIMDANAQTPVGSLSGNSTIDRSDFVEGKWNAMFATATHLETIGSIRVYINGRYSHIDNNYPLSLCKDANGTFETCLFDDGTYQVTVLPYTKANARGLRFPPFEFNITVITSFQVNGVMSISLIESESGISFGRLSQNHTIDRSLFTIGRWNIKAETVPLDVGSVIFYLNGRRISVVNSAPFTMCGFANDTYGSCNERIQDGNHSVVAIAYTDINGRGRRLPDHSVDFTVITPTPVDGVVEVKTVDGLNGTVHDIIVNNSVIDRSVFTQGKWALLATVAPISIGSVYFYFNGVRVNADMEAPFYSCEDKNNSYIPCSIGEGIHELKAIAYALPHGKGYRYPANVMHFTVVTSEQVTGIRNIKLADTYGRAVRNLVEGDVIDRKNFQAGQFALVAETFDGVKSVSFYINGRRVKVDNNSPFEFCGDEDSSFGSCFFLLPEGQHTIRALAHEGENGSGNQLPDREFSISVISSVYNAGIVSFNLKDGNHTVIEGVENNSTILRSNFFRGMWNMELVASPASIQSVAIYVNGKYARTDNDLPFTLCDKECSHFKDGHHSIKYVSFTEANRKGKAYPERVHNFTVRTARRVEGVMELHLIDIATGEKVGNVVNGTIINRGDFTSGQWGIKIITLPEASVETTSYVNNRRLFVDKEPPFSFCNYVGNNEDRFPSCVWNLKDGPNVIKVTAMEIVEGAKVLLPGIEYNVEVFSPKNIDGVTSLKAVDSTTDTQRIENITDGFILDRAQYHLGRWNMEALVEPSDVASVRFYVDGRYVRIDNDSPFALCAEEGGDFDSCYLSEGRHIIKAIAYTSKNGRGYKYSPYELEMNVATSTPVEGVMSLSIVETQTNRTVKNLVDDDVIMRSSILFGSWNIEMNTTENVDYVKVYINNRYKRTVSILPFSVCGFEHGSFLNCLWDMREGEHTVKLLPYETNTRRRLPEYVVTFQIKTTSAVDGVIQYGLIDWSTSTKHENVTNGGLIDRARFDLGRMNIILYTAPADIKSVKIYVNKRHFRIDNSIPFTLCDDSNPGYCKFADGDYLIETIAYTELNGRGKAYPTGEHNIVIETSTQVEGVMSLSLIGVADFEDHGTLEQNDVIDRSNVTLGIWALRANTLPATVGSVVFYRNGRKITVDNTPPYYACGEDSEQPKLCNWLIPEGQNVIKAIAYSSANGRGEALPFHEVNALVISSSRVDGVMNFTLFDIDSGEDIRLLPNLGNITVGEGIFGNWGIAAGTHTLVGSVSLYVNNRLFSRDNSPPYTLCGEAEGQPKPCSLRPGSYVIKGIAHTSANGRGNSYEPYQISVTILPRPPLPVALFLYDMSSLSRISEVEHLGVLDRASTLEGQWNIVADVGELSELIGSSVQSLEFYVNRKFYRLSNAPFKVCNDTSFGCTWEFKENTYSLEIKGFSEPDGNGKFVGEMHINYQLITSERCDGVVSYSLVNANNTSEQFDELSDGIIIDPEECPDCSYNIEGEPLPSSVGSVKFQLNGKVWIDNESPFHACERECILQMGRNDLKGTAYTEKDAKGFKYPEYHISLWVGSKASDMIVKLVDAVTDKDARVMSQNDIVDRSLLTHGQWAMRFLPPALLNAQSMKIYVDGRKIHTDSRSPYSSCGDKNGDIAHCLWIIPEGTHEIKAIGFSKSNGKGGKVIEHVSNVTIFSSERVDGIMKLTLIDTTTGNPISNLEDGGVIDQEVIREGLWNAEAHVVPIDGIESVVFIVNGARHIRNYPPYSLCGIKSGSFLPCAYLPGNYSISVTAYTKSNGRGNSYPNLSLSFSVTEPPIPPPVVVFELVDLANMNTTLLPRNGTWNISNNDIAAVDWTVVVKTDRPVGSVLFYLDGNLFESHVSSPHGLCGHEDQELTSCFGEISEGSHLLRIIIREMETNELCFEVEVTLNSYVSYVDVFSEAFVVDTLTGRDVSLVSDGGIVDLSLLSGLLFNVRFATQTAVGSVRVAMNYWSRIENEEPYTLCGYSAGNYTDCEMIDETFVVTLTAFTQPNGKGSILSQIGLSFTLSYSRIMSFDFSLYNEDSNSVVRSLSSGEEVQSGEFTGHWNILCTPSRVVGSLQHYVNSSLVSLSNTGPFFLCELNDNSIRTCKHNLDYGLTTVRAVATSGKDGSGIVIGASSIDFKLVETVIPTFSFTLFTQDTDGDIVSTRQLSHRDFLQFHETHGAVWNIWIETSSPIGRLEINGVIRPPSTAGKYNLCDRDCSTQLRDRWINFSAKAFFSEAGKTFFLSSTQLEIFIETPVTGHLEWIDVDTGSHIRNISHVDIIETTSLSNGNWNAELKLSRDVAKVEVYINGSLSHSRIEAPFMLCDAVTCKENVNDGTHDIVFKLYRAHNGLSVIGEQGFELVVTTPIIPQIFSFILIDGDGNELGLLEDASEVRLVEGEVFNIKAMIDPPDAQLDAVIFVLNGIPIVRPHSPYLLCEPISIGCDFDVGQATISALPVFPKDASGNASRKEIDILILPAYKMRAILLDASSNTVIRELSHHDAFETTESLDGHFSVEFRLSETVNQVKIYSGGNLIQTEYHVPYTLCGDAPAGNYHSCKEEFEDGLYTFLIDAIDERNHTVYSKSFIFTITTPIIPIIPHIYLVDRGNADGPVFTEIQDDFHFRLSSLSSPRFALMAVPEPSPVGSIEFIINGTSAHVDNDVPYCMCGNSGGACDPCHFSPGVVTFGIVPYEKESKTGLMYPMKEVSIFVLPPFVASLHLIDATTNQVIRSLSHKDAIETSEPSEGKWTLEVKVSEPVNRVVFYLNGELFSTERAYPYTLCGNTSSIELGSCNSKIEDGIHSLRIHVVGQNGEVLEDKIYELEIITPIIPFISELRLVNSEGISTPIDDSITFRLNDSVKLNIHAFLEPDNGDVGVAMTLYGETRYEYHLPYTLCPLATGCEFIPGTTSIHTQPFSESNSTTVDYPAKEVTLFILPPYTMRAFLVDATLNTVIREVSHQDTIETTETSAGEWSVEFVMSEAVKEIRIYNNDALFNTATHVPYLLCGRGGSSFNSCVETLGDGQHSLRVEAIGEDEEVVFSKTFVFTISTPIIPEIPHVYLVDVDEDHVETLLQDGSTFRLSSNLQKQFSFRVVPDPSPVGSIEFRLNGTSVQTENYVPYCLCGDTRGKCKPCDDIVAGVLTLELIPYELRNKGGTEYPPKALTLNVKPAFTSTLHLVDASTHSIVRQLGTKDTIETNELSQGEWSVEVKVSEHVHFVKFYVDSHALHTQSEPPYAACGTTSPNTYASCGGIVDDGKHEFLIEIFDSNEEILSRKVYEIEVITPVIPYVKDVFLTESGNDLQSIGDGDTFRLKDGSIFNIRAVLEPDLGDIGVAMTLYGITREERYDPYTLCPLASGCAFVPGEATIHLKPFAEDGSTYIQFPEKEFKINILAPYSMSAVFIDADTGSIIRDASHQDSFLTTEASNGRFSVEFLMSEPVKQIKIYKNDSLFQVENHVPFALCGNIGSSYRTCHERLGDGQHTLRIEAMIGSSNEPVFTKIFTFTVSTPGNSLKYFMYI